MRKMFALTVLLLLAASNALAQGGQGFTSETHKANVGKILWAKQRIKMDVQDKLKYETVFSASDPIYGRVYLNNPLPLLARDSQKPNCENSEGRYLLKLIIDKQDKGFIHEQKFESHWTTGQITPSLAPGDEPDRLNQKFPATWMKIANDLPAGQHDVQVEFWAGKPGCEMKYAEGSFTFKKEAGEKVAGGAIPKPLKKDPALEAEMINAIKAKGWKNETPVKVIIIEADWRIIRDAFGNIVKREINTNTILKRNDGSCRLTDLSFDQAYQGGEKYGATSLFGIGLKNIDVNCADAQ
ncbi:MAG: hypothetical protein WAW37_12900 [Syntrophobacteraceae bacterium]